MRTRGYTYGDWAEAAVKELKEEKAITMESSFGDKYRNYKVREENKKLREMISTSRQNQAEAYGLPQLMKKGMTEEEKKEYRELASKENPEGKVFREYADPKHLSDDADFVGVDREGLELILPSPNHLEERGKEDHELRSGWRYSSGLMDGSAAGEYIKKHVNPNIIDESPEGALRYIRKAYGTPVPVYTDEELISERKEQYARDESISIAAIDAALKQKSCEAAGET